MHTGQESDGFNMETEQILKPRSVCSEASSGIIVSERGGLRSRGRFQRGVGPGQRHVWSRPESSSMVAENTSPYPKQGVLCLSRALHALETILGSCIGKS